MRRWTVKVRLLAGFGVLLMMVVLVGSIAAVRVRALRETVRIATQEVAVNVQAANTLVDAVNQGARFKLALFAATSPELIEQSTTGVASARENINAAYARLDSLFGDSTGVDSAAFHQLTTIKHLRKVHAASFDSAAAVRKAGDIANAETMLSNVVLPTLSEYIGGIDALISTQDERLREEALAADAQAVRGLWVIGLLCLLAVVVGFALARAIFVSITQPLAELTRAAHRLAEGDCEITITTDGARDEVADLGVAMQQMAAADASVADAAFHLAAGDTSVKVAVRGDRDVLGAAMSRVKDTLTSLTDVTTGLTHAAQEGRLSERAPADQFEGTFRDLVQGLNATLDSLLAPVAEARATLERLANRDLSARMGEQYAGDHAALARALNTAAHALDQTLGEVATSATQVNSASLQIADGSQSLAQGASQQAGSLEEVASGLSEIGAMTRQNAAHAAEARTLSQEAQQSSARGVSEMKLLSDAITRIKNSSDSTARIVKTIDEIAFQTNLLALNAAVEAARAGDAGRGFAVVAEEVRSLALRSAEAAKQTSQLIEQAVNTANEGVMLNAAVLAQLEDIDTQIGRVGAVMNDVAEASERQRDSVDHIGQAVEQMNGVTQQVAANAEESASAAEELAGQATTLSALVREFTLTDDAPPRRSVTNAPLRVVSRRRTKQLQGV